MASYSIATVSILALLFVISSALDLSILSHKTSNNNNNNERSEDDVMALYESWLVKHGKSYNALGEKQRRFGIFKDNLDYIEQHNSKKLSFRLGLNLFADLTNQEYRSRFLGRVDHKSRVTRPKSDRYAFQVGDNLPESIDWREKGAVVPVKNQGSCGMYSPILSL
ncbi:Cysteine proteinase RD21A [Bienertia sinuspersici]